jgi:hypothetical protein
VLGKGPQFSHGSKSAISGLCCSLVTMSEAAANIVKQPDLLRKG